MTIKGDKTVKVKFLKDENADVLYRIDSMRAQLFDDGFSIVDEDGFALYSMDLVPVSAPDGVQTRDLYDVRVEINGAGAACFIASPPTSREHYAEAYFDPDEEGVINCDSWHVDGNPKMSDVIAANGDETVLNCLSEAMRKLASSTTSKLGRAIKQKAEECGGCDDLFLIEVVDMLCAGNAEA